MAGIIIEFANEISYMYLSFEKILNTSYFTIEIVDAIFNNRFHDFYIDFTTKFQMLVEHLSANEFLLRLLFRILHTFH